MSLQLRNARVGDVRELAAMLARAFQDDPVSIFSFPDPAKRAKALPRFFEIELRHEYMGDGEIYVPEDLAGAALWAPPGKPRPGLRALVHLMPLVPAIGARLPRMLRLVQATESRHPKEPHFYLGVLGTEPSRQHRGVGSALLKPVLERCDGEGIPAYLESSKESNVPFYARHGFEVTEELHTPGGGPSLWLMWRTPRA